MKHITTSKQNNDIWDRRFVDEKDCDQIITESTSIDCDGKPLAIFLKGVIPLGVNVAAIGAAKTMGLSTNNRGTAGGLKADYKIKEDGTKSKTMRVKVGWEVNSGIVGFFEREPRRPYCHATAWVDKYPEAFKQHVHPMAHLVNEHFRDYAPAAYEYQEAYANKTPKEFMIGNSVFTTITVNKNFRTACHKDAGDLPGGMSCMTVASEGKYKGAHLILPAFRLGFDIQMGDLIIFDPHQYHGNTQIVPYTPKAARYSFVFYYRELMQHCLTPREELAYAKNRKPGDKLFPEDK